VTRTAVPRARAGSLADDGHAPVLAAPAGGSTHQGGAARAPSLFARNRCVHGAGRPAAEGGADHRRDGCMRSHPRKAMTVRRHRRRPRRGVTGPISFRLVPLASPRGLGRERVWPIRMAATAGQNRVPDRREGRYSEPADRVPWTVPAEHLDMPAAVAAVEHACGAVERTTRARKPVIQKDWCSTPPACRTLAGTGTGLAFRGRTADVRRTGGACCTWLGD